MHISEGVLSWQVLAGSGVVALAGTAVGVKKIEPDQIARTGILAAAFFVASLIHVPVGPSNVHLILNGLVGIMLGWAAVPAILVALLLQAVLFQFGGITTLGVNTIIMALPAVACYYCFRLMARPHDPDHHVLTFIVSMGCGAMAVLGGALLAATALVFSEEKFFEVAALLVTAHVPIIIVEGLVTGFAVAFLQRVKPSLLQ